MSDPKLFHGTLLTAQSAIETAAAIRPDIISHAREVTLYATFGAGTSAGTVVLEAAPDPTYTGTWSNVGSIAWAAASRTHHLSVTGCHRALRARISVGIVGGTVDVHVVAN